MRLTKLQDALAGVNRIGVDTDAIIYFVQSHPAYDALVSEVFRRVGAGQLIGFTSVVSLTETLILPLRTSDAPLRQRFRDLLLRSQGLFTMPVSIAIAERAAEVRAAFNLKTPDAIQAATALEANCNSAG